MVERCHPWLKGALRARIAGPDWPLHLPWVLMGLQVAHIEETTVSAAELVFGAPLVLPGQMLDTEEPPPADVVAKLRQSGPPLPSRPISYAQMAARPPAALMPGAFMYVRKGGTVAPLLPLYSGPFKVLIYGLKIFKLHVGKQVEVVSINHLKSYRGTIPVQPAQSPTRGPPLAG
jgi:hypothetical protein